MDESVDLTCPRCQVALWVPDNRFSIWCPACDWNLDPLGGVGSKQHRTRDLAHHDRMFNRALAGGTGGKRPSSAWLGAVVLAGAVNLVTLALAGTGVWLLVAGNWPERIMAVTELVIVLVLRPRLGRMPRHTLDRSTAPRLYALAERAAAELGTRPVDVIAVDERYGSGCTKAGLRRRRVLILGLPLWEALTMDQRLALLGHDLGRLSTGKSLSAAWIQTALDALTTWADVIRPVRALDDERQKVTDRHAFDAGGNRQSSIVGMGVALAQPLQDFLSRAALGCHRLLSRLRDRSGGQAEYRADENAARIASAASVQGLLRALLLRETALFALERAAWCEDDLWEALRVHLASVPDMEFERRLRLSELRGDAFDDGCPPTHLRMKFIGKLSCPEAAVVVSSGETEAIDAELAPLRASIANDLKSRTVHGG
ncbi:M48 family metallopeptidase [Streptomyces eurythermus]|uniref:M48 family metallopeptidase n=1 Tax=Streptomyces eurythermus TaxID=42237 RepID=UPI0033E15D51